MHNEDIEIQDDENGFRIHYETADVGKIIQSLASHWPRIRERTREQIARLGVAPPQRIVVLVRPDCGLLFFTLESDGSFVHEVASVTVQFVEDACMECDERAVRVYHELREIARCSFKEACVIAGLTDFDLPVAIDDYQSTNPATFELLTR